MIIDTDDLATVCGAFDSGAAAVSAGVGAISGMCTWAMGTGMGLMASVSSGIMKSHGPGNRLGNAITIGTGVAAGLAGAYYAGKSFYNGSTKKQ